MKTPYQNKLQQIQQERREEKQRIKKEFVDSGDADKMIDVIHEKMKPSITVEELPF